MSAPLKRRSASAALSASGPRTRASVRRVQDRRAARRARTRGLIAGVVACGVLAAAAVVGSAIADSSTLDLAPQADTYVSSARPATSFADQASLWASSRQSNVRTALLQFVVPAGTSASQATLILTRDVHHFPATTIKVSTASAVWPAQVLYSNQPAIGDTVATANLDPRAKSVSIDVSKIVQGAGVYAFQISSPIQTNAVRFLAREAGKNGPVLRIVPSSDDSGKPGPPVVPQPTTAPSPTPSTSPTETGTPTSTTTSPPPSTVTVAPTTPSGSCSVSPILVPSCGVWFGAAPDSLTAVPVPRDVAMANFERRVGQPVDITHTYHVDGNQFPTAIERAWADDPVHPRMLLINWKPTFGHSWAEVANGAADVGIDKQASYLTSTFAEKKFFLTIFHEPENDVNPAAGSGYTAVDYRNMYRHVALRLRADGVKNAILVMNYMGAAKWTGASWFSELYPGDDVVDWVSYDPYATAAPGYMAGDFADMVNRADMYHYMTTAHKGKPIMLSEWGMADDLKTPNVKPGFFLNVASELAVFPAIKALIYFDSPNAHAGDTRTNSTSASQNAFNSMVSQKVFTASSVKN